MDVSNRFDFPSVKRVGWYQGGNLANLHDLRATSYSAGCIP